MATKKTTVEEPTATVEETLKPTPTPALTLDKEQFDLLLKSLSQLIPQPTPATPNAVPSVKILTYPATTSPLRIQDDINTHLLALRNAAKGTNLTLHVYPPEVTYVLAKGTTVHVQYTFLYTLTPRT